MIFGPTLAFTYSIEWQKRGLPHVHILLWLVNKIRANDVDKIISAEIPDVRSDTELHEIVIKNMIHGPCGPLNPKCPCMKNKKCSKSFPKELINETQYKENSYPLYRRRSVADGGFMTTKIVDGVSINIDNRWVVPYCSVLSKMFKAHINVELCNSVDAIKYIMSYINKGTD